MCKLHIIIIECCNHKFLCMCASIFQKLWSQPRGRQMYEYAFLYHGTKAHVGICIKNGIPWGELNRLSSASGEYMISLASFWMSTDL